VTKTAGKWAQNTCSTLRVPEITPLVEVFRKNKKITEIIGVIKKTCEIHYNYLSNFRAFIGVKQLHSLMEYYLVARSNLITMGYGYKLEL